MSNSIDLQSFTLEHVRGRVLDRLKYDDGEHDGDYHMNPDFRDWVVSDAAVNAAVLIGMVERQEGVCVVLTKRAERLTSHSGQVAFPGGKIDAEDGSPEAAAMREAEEEIGLENRHVDILGRLPDYYSGSGFRIAPILAIIDPAASISANLDEVDYVFEVPLAFLMNSDNHKTGSRMFDGSERFYLEMPYKEHFIWGVTAGIIRVMHDRVFT